MCVLKIQQKKLKLHCPIERYLNKPNRFKIKKMVNEHSLKLAFSQIRQDFDLIRRQLQELNLKIENSSTKPNGNITIHELQEIKNEVNEIKLSINDSFSPEDITEMKSKAKPGKKEEKEETQEKVELISPEKISFTEEVEEDIEGVNALADEYY